MIVAQLPDPNSYVAMGWLLTAALVVGGGYLTILKIQVARKQLAAPPLPTGQQPQPFVTKRAEEYVLKPELEKAVGELKEAITDVEGRVDKKLEHTEGVVRDRFHKLDNDLQGIQAEAQNGRELATEQFQNIEGRLGELKATSEHTNALAIRTDQCVRQVAQELPEKIANALSRSRR